MSHSAATSWNIPNWSFAQLILDWMSTFKRIKSNKLIKIEKAKLEQASGHYRNWNDGQRSLLPKKATGRECLIDVCTKLISLLHRARVITIPKSDNNSRRKKKVYSFYLQIWVWKFFKCLNPIAHFKIILFLDFMLRM